MARKDPEAQSQNTVIDSLATNLQGKMVVSIDVVDWAEAGKNLKYAILLRLSMGKNIQKKSMEELLPKIWKIKNTAMFWKVERDVMLINFSSEKDQLRVLNGGPRSFEGSAIIVQKWLMGMTEDDLDNTKINVWVNSDDFLLKFDAINMQKILLTLLVNW